MDRSLGSCSSLVREHPAFSRSLEALNESGITRKFFLTLGVTRSGLQCESESLVTDRQVLVLVSAGARVESCSFGRNFAAVRHVLVRVGFPCRLAAEFSR